MLDRKHFSKKYPIRFRGPTIADEFEEKLIKFYENTQGLGYLLIDFLNSSYIEIAVLVNCIAAIVQRQTDNKRTFIGIPRDKRVRDFLKMWRFPEAVEVATGKEFNYFLLSEDLTFLGEKQTTYGGTGTALDALEYNPDWQPSTQSKRNFFEFCTHRADSDYKIEPGINFGSLPRKESRRWADDLIMQVLRDFFASFDTIGDIARVAIYESLSNAVRHPKATQIHAVSRFFRQEDINKKESLRICIWDDGESIAGTLKSSLIEGKKIRSYTLPGYEYELITLIIQPFFKGKGDAVIEKVVRESDDPTLNSSDAILLLSSLYPGISRAVEDAIPDVDKYEEVGQNGETEMRGKPGRGLHALKRVVIDQFGGNIVIRSGRYRLKLERSKRAHVNKYNARYLCKMTEYPECFPIFRGNLLIIQISKSNFKI